MRIPRPIVKTYRLPQRLLGQQFCWSEMSSVSKIKIKCMALTQHPSSVAATHHDFQVHDCHVERRLVRSTKALLHLLLPLVIALVVPMEGSVR